MLDAAQTFKPAVYHNSQSSAQCFTLLHAGEYIKADIRANQSQKVKHVAAGGAPYLCDVSTTERPVLIMSRIRFQRNLRALGSMPVVGSSWRTQEQSRGSHTHTHKTQNTSPNCFVSFLEIFDYILKL